jgi:hypothetical protein
MLVGLIEMEFKEQQKIYPAKCSKFHMPNQNEPNNYAEKLMEELTKLVDKPNTSNQQYTSWILEKSWRINYAKAEARKNGNTESTTEVRTEKKPKNNKKSCVQNANKHAKGAYYSKTRGWYSSTPDHTPKPTSQDEQKTKEECETIF